MSGGINSSVVKVLNNINASNPNGNEPNSTEIDEVVITKIKPLKSKKVDVILPDMGEIKYPEIGDLIKLNNYSQTYTNAEDKLHLYKYGDPLTLNFKVIIDFDRRSGLFAPEFNSKSEENHDSALAYLRRIGETERYNMLKHWITVFKTLVKDFDFLFLTIDGLEVVQTKPNHEFFLDKEKIKLTLRETTDMIVQSLLVTYNNIVYDRIRKVTVLPSNLRKFDCYVVVFSAGYYNILFHDIDSQDKSNLDNKVLPTKRKLADEIFNLNTISDFNHTLYEFVSCQFDFESGSMFADSVSNEMSSDFVKNNITFTYKFATFSGTYNNIMGDENWYNVLAQAAAENRLQNLARFQYMQNIGGAPGFVADGKNIFSKENLEKMLGNTVYGDVVKNAKSFMQKDTYINMFNQIKSKTLTSLEDKLVNQLPTKLLGPHSVIGQTLLNFNPDHVKNLIQNTVDLGIGKLQDLYDTGVTKVNNLILTNYNDNLADIYNNVIAGNKPTNQIEVIEQQQKPPYFDNNPNNEFNEVNPYVRPNNPKYDDTIDDTRFIKGTNGVTFFGAPDEEQGKFKSVSKNMYVRKGF